MSVDTSERESRASSGPESTRGVSQRERLFLFDTTLRDGQQAQGVDFSAADKLKIAAALDDLGIDYIEGGWPGANPTETELFAAPPKLTHARFLAFGMTKRSGRSAADDEVLAEVVNTGAKKGCGVGRCYDLQL